MIYKSDKDRIFNNINSMTDNGCWEWMGTKLRGGYGGLSVRGKTWQAHRFSYVVFIGEIPDGMLVCHACDNPSCVNPNHLFLGTHKTNAEDRVKKKRSSVGESFPKSKLKEQEILEIRRYASLGVTRRTLAKMFRVGSTCITYVVNKRTWRHI